MGLEADKDISRSFMICQLVHEFKIVSLDQTRRLRLIIGLNYRCQSISIDEYWFM